MKILIVDDEPVARLSLGRILAPLAPEIVEAEDGEEAWSLLEGGLRPVVCCTDVMMPRLGGLELLQRVRGHAVLGDLPVVLISSAADRATVQSAASAGVAAYILKPFLAMQTRGTVDRVLREHLAARSEHVQVTRRRTGLHLQELGRCLREFAADALDCVERLAGDEDLGGELQRLQGSARSLGLWRAAALLGHVAGATTRVPAHALALEEVIRLAGEQLVELEQRRGVA